MAGCFLDLIRDPRPHELSTPGPLGRTHAGPRRPHFGSDRGAGARPCARPRSAHAAPPQTSERSVAVIHASWTTTTTRARHTVRGRAAAAAAAAVLAGAATVGDPTVAASCDAAQSHRRDPRYPRLRAIPRLAHRRGISARGRRQPSPLHRIRANWHVRAARRSRATRCGTAPHCDAVHVDVTSRDVAQMPAWRAVLGFARPAAGSVLRYPPRGAAS